MEKEEKKVEYLELIYDLIFVYVVGRNNSLMHNIENGFVTRSTFLVYLLCTLAIVQIWTYSTYYTNMYGRGSVRNHAALFLNMYLLYYIGEGTRVHWQGFQNQYHFAWALILINTGVQYALELRHHRGSAHDERVIRHMMTVLFGEAVLVLACIPVYNWTGAWLAGVPILYGIGMTWLFADPSTPDQVDFPHLSERAMLYVVFSFGEMIIAIASYFEGAFTLNSVYFSAMSFLIAAGLFLCYGALYDRIIDRERATDGLGYMMTHIFLIFAMNNITTSLEFMRDEGVLLLPKLLFLLGSFLLFFLCLFALLRYAKPALKLNRRLLLPVAGISVLFLLLMFLLRESMRGNILVSVIYVFALFWLIRRHSLRDPEACLR